ncbi:Protein kinase domain [Sesbania bispinosa]|nr:Protein kinase domain [Sesbania bispinosa]
MDFFSEYGDANRYKIQEVIGKGSYGVVCSAIDTHTGEKVAIKKIHDIFEHISDAARILREIKLLRLLRHPDIVEIKHIMLPPSRKDFKDIYVVFELMESDLHQVIKANDDLTKEHYQFFLYQLLRALKYIHTANVYHRDLKPKNILANANCKLKICDFGLARVAFSDTPTTIFWTVGTDVYCLFNACVCRIMLLQGGIELQSYVDHFTRSPSVGSDDRSAWDSLTGYYITGKEIPTSMRKKQPVPFAQKFPNADPLALRLLERLLAFDPKDRPTAEEALADPYFKGLAKVEREPSCQPITKMEFEFERRRVTKEEIRDAVDQFRKQFAHLEENGKNGPVMPLDRKHVSLPRPTIVHSNTVHQKEQTNVASSKNRPTADEYNKNTRDTENPMPRSMQGPQRIPLAKPGKVVGPVVPYEYGSVVKDSYDPRTFIRGSMVPSQTIHPAYYYQRPSTGNQERLATETDKGVPLQAKHAQQCGVNAKIAPDIAINIDTNPFFMTRAGVNKLEQDDQIAIETNLLQSKAQYGGISAAAGATAHRKSPRWPTAVTPASKIAALESERDELARENAEKKEEIKKLKAEIERLRNDEAEAEELEADAVTLRQEAISATSAAEEARTEAVELQKVLEERECRIEILEREGKGLKQWIAEREMKIRDLERKVVIVEMREAEERSKRVRMEEEMREKIDEKEREIEELKGEIEELEKVVMGKNYELEKRGERENGFGRES